MNISQVPASFWLSLQSAVTLKRAADGNAFARALDYIGEWARSEVANCTSGHQEFRIILSAEETAMLMEALGSNDIDLLRSQVIGTLNDIWSATRGNDRQRLFPLSLAVRYADTEGDPAFCILPQDNYFVID